MQTMIDIMYYLLVDWSCGTWRSSMPKTYAAIQLLVSIHGHY